MRQGITHFQQFFMGFLGKTGYHLFAAVIKKIRVGKSGGARKIHLPAQLPDPLNKQRFGAGAGGGKSGRNTRCPPSAYNNIVRTIVP
jgi:hypothetical protein